MNSPKVWYEIEIYKDKEWVFMHSTNDIEEAYMLSKQWFPMSDKLVRISLAFIDQNGHVDYLGSHCYNGENGQMTKNLRKYIEEESCRKDCSSEQGT